jgi:hypothetical protein
MISIRRFTKAVYVSQEHGTIRTVRRCFIRLQRGEAIEVQENCIVGNDGIVEDVSAYRFEPETKQRIGAVTYIVKAHFDETRENLPEKIRRLLNLEIENRIAQLRNPGL